MIISEEIAPHRHVSSKNHIYTVPKSGTHFVIEIFKNLNELSYINHIPAAGIDKETKAIFLIRDPRDVWVSLVSWFTKSASSSEKDSPFFNAWLKMSFEERLLKTIRGDSDIPFAIRRDQTINYMSRALEQYKLKTRNIKFIKFEDLIGPQFNGSPKEVQQQQLYDMLCFLGVSIQKANIKELIENSIGKPGTFTKVKKKVGQWQTIYTPEITEIFKKYYNPYVLGFEYESTKNWDCQKSTLNKSE